MLVALVQFTVWNDSLSEQNSQLQGGKPKPRGGKCPSSHIINSDCIKIQVNNMIDPIEN